MCGFAAGGALALCAAGEDPRIRGVAAFSAPADFAERAVDARRFVAQARAAGVIRDPGFPARPRRLGPGAARDPAARA